MLHYLRYILVLTQLVVICVFLYRFNVDQEIVDIKDNLLQKSEIVKVSGPLITEGERIYLKSTNIETLLKQQNSLGQMVEYLLARFPAKLKLDDLKVSSDQLVFNGTTDDPTIIQSFYKKLQQDNRFKDIKLVNISKSDTGYAFSFALTGFVAKSI